MAIDQRVQRIRQGDTAVMHGLTQAGGLNLQRGAIKTGVMTWMMGYPGAMRRLGPLAQGAAGQALIMRILRQGGEGRFAQRVRIGLCRIGFALGHRGRGRQHQRNRGKNKEPHLNFAARALGCLPVPAIENRQTVPPVPRMLRKKSFTLSGHRTSVALEAEFWAVIADTARERGVALAALVAKIDETRGDRPLASALRLFALAAVQAAP